MYILNIYLFAMSDFVIVNIVVKCVNIEILSYILQSTSMYVQSIYFKDIRKETDIACNSQICS